MNRIIIATVLALTASTGAANAHEGGYGWGGWWGQRQAARQAEIDRRQARQHERIHRGVRSGQLTPSEYQRLQAEQARIRDLERRAKADGRVSRYEAWQIRRAQDEASRHIRDERHDDNRAGGRRY